MSRAAVPTVEQSTTQLTPLPPYGISETDLQRNVIQLTSSQVKAGRNNSISLIEIAVLGPDAGTSIAVKSAWESTQEADARREQRNPKNMEQVPQKSKTKERPAKSNCHNPYTGSVTVYNIGHTVNGLSCCVHDIPGIISLLFIS